MGGIGSGAKRSTNVGNLEDTLALDIRALKRLGAIQQGTCVVNTVMWRHCALRGPQALLRADLSADGPGGTLRITGDMPDGPLRQDIAIDGIRSSLGGWRCYFLCPVTGRRCEVLYYVRGRFASRKAQGLSYTVQNMTDLSRASRKVRKLHSRLRGSGNLPGPRGANRLDLAIRLRDAEFEAKALYVERLRAAADRSGAHRMPGDKS